MTTYTIHSTLDLQTEKVLVYLLGFFINSSLVLDAWVVKGLVHFTHFTPLHCFNLEKKLGFLLIKGSEICAAYYFSLRLLYLERQITIGPVQFYLPIFHV